MQRFGSIFLISAVLAASLVAIQPSAAWAGNMEEFGRKIDRELADMKKGIDRMSDKAKETGDKAGDSVDRALKQARENWEKTKDALIRFQENGKQGAEEMRRGVEGAMDDLRKAYKDALDKMQ